MYGFEEITAFENKDIIINKYLSIISSCAGVEQIINSFFWIIILTISLAISK